MSLNSLLPRGGSLISAEDPILVTGSTGFIGPFVVQMLLENGFRRLICLTRSAGKGSRLEALARRFPSVNLRIVEGNLVYAADCAEATRNVRVIFHLAAGGSAKSYADAVLNSVVTTRNLLETGHAQGCLRRFVNVSSLAVYDCDAPPRNLLDETCPVEKQPLRRGDAYCYAKVKQDELVLDYCTRHRLSYVIVRPGYVYGPGRPGIPSRVGIDTFGAFLHLGGSNKLPITYVENCASAIVAAGLSPSADGEIFNIIDDDLPSSREFLREYKRQVQSFRSIYVPRFLSHALCGIWERYSRWSEGQLPPTFTSARWHAYWKQTRYSNAKLKCDLGWTPRVPTAEALARFFQSCVAERPKC